MKKLLPFLLIAFLFSCSNNSAKLDEISKRQDAIEARIDSIQSDMKFMATTDSIFLELLKPGPGSLLFELQQMENN